MIEKLSNDGVTCEGHLCYYYGMRRPRSNEDPVRDVKKANGDAAFLDDVVLSRRNPRLTPSDSEGLPDRVAEQLVRDVDEFLAENEVRSEEELDFWVAKLDTAIAINNDPIAKEKREELIRKFGGGTNGR